MDDDLENAILEFDDSRLIHNFDETLDEIAELEQSLGAYFSDDDSRATPTFTSVPVVPTRSPESKYERQKRKRLEFDLLSDREKILKKLTVETLRQIIGEHQLGRRQKKRSIVEKVVRDSPLTLDQLQHYLDNYKPGNNGYPLPEGATKLPNGMKVGDRVVYRSVHKKKLPMYFGVIQAPLEAKPMIRFVFARLVQDGPGQFKLVPDWNDFHQEASNKNTNRLTLYNEGEIYRICK